MTVIRINNPYVPGSLIAGRFTIVRHLATGSMGAVFLARDRKIGDAEVALKVLHSKFLTDPVAFKRFSNEVVFARKLTHPNIVRIYDFEESSSGEKVISMEYVHGNTLADLIKEVHGDVPFHDPPVTGLYAVDFKRLLNIYKKLLEGVAFAHNSGILHRDLKPCNVLIDSSDEPKIGDFGLATVAGVSTGLTNDGSALIGTPDYMAPEQVLGQRMTARSDIYSLGSIAFELLVGRPPFIADGPLAAAYMQVQNPFPSLERMPEFIPRNFLKLILRATQKSPHERFSSVDEMIEMLDDKPRPGEIRFQNPSITATQNRPKMPNASGIAGKFGSAPPKYSEQHPVRWGVMIFVLVTTILSFTFTATSYLLKVDRDLQMQEQPSVKETTTTSSEKAPIAVVVDPKKNKKK